MKHPARASANIANVVICAHSLPLLSPHPACRSQTDFEKDVDLACQTGELSFAPPPNPDSSHPLPLPPLFVRRRISTTERQRRAVTFSACLRECWWNNAGGGRGGAGGGHAAAPAQLRAKLSITAILPHKCSAGICLDETVLNCAW